MGRSLADIDAEMARLRRERKAARVQTFGPGRKLGGRTFKPEGKGQRDPRQEDAAYLAWLHVDTDCIACMIEGRPANPHGLQSTIEAAGARTRQADP